MSFETTPYQEVVLVVKPKFLKQEKNEKDIPLRNRWVKNGGKKQ